MIAMVGRMSMPSAISLAKFSATRWPHGSSETMRCGSRPLRERPDGRGRMGVGEVGPADRIERAGGDRERAIDRIGAAMGADDVAVLRARHRADDRPALARGGAPQWIGKSSLAPGAGCEVRRIWSVRLERVIARPQNGDGPPRRRAWSQQRKINAAVAAEKAV